MRAASAFGLRTQRTDGRLENRARVWFIVPENFARDYQGVRHAKMAKANRECAPI